MITEHQLAQTELSFNFSISPINHIICDLSGILGQFNQQLLSAFYPLIISKRVNTAITELIDNAIRYGNSVDGDIELSLLVSTDKVAVTISNSASKEQFDKVKENIDRINSTDNIKKLLKETIRMRRKERTNEITGGIGLIRLAAENKFTLSTRYDDSKQAIIINSQLKLGGLA